MKNNSIRIELFITKYEKNTFINTKRVKLSYTTNEETAREIVKNACLRYVKDPTGTSLFESIKATCFINGNVKIYFKEIRYNTCETWGNY